MDAVNFASCSIQMDYKWPYNWTDHLNTTWNTTSTESDDPKAKQLGAITGILIAFFIDVLLSFEYNKSAVSSGRGLTKIFNANIVSRTLLLTILVLTLPFVVLSLLLAFVYKVLCAVIIKNKDKYFVSLLDSFDVFWSLESDTSKSIINVLGIIESHSPYAIADSIKEKLRQIVSNEYNQKIFYRRNEQFGFYYWCKYNTIDMNEYVEIVELPNQSKSIGVTDLEDLMTELQDQPLPYKDEGLFKIIITKQSVGHHEDIKKEYGIIFRVHHSVGDGVALIEFLCKTFADKTDNFPVNMFSIPESCNHDSPGPGNLIDMMQTLLEIPICFADGILRKPDESALHGPTLEGKKVFKWTESDENLLTMVKEIKDNIQQFHFSDVLLTSLSRGVKYFLSERMARVPDEVAVILPVRFPKSSVVDDTILKNDFSVTILDVPMKLEDDIINEIKHRCNRLRRSADPLTNYYFLKLVCSVLPKSVLAPLLNSSQATMVFSNMPGPSQLSICGGNILKSLLFFVPHKGTTGLGVTCLCYGGILRFAAMADAALVSNSEELGCILDGMVAEIKRLHRIYASN